MLGEHKISLCIEQLDGLSVRQQEAALDAIRRIAPQLTHRNVSWRKWLLSFDLTQEDAIDTICGVLEIDVARYLKESRPYVTKEELALLASDGFTIGAHGRKHIRLDLLGVAEREAEITGSTQEIMNWLGTEHLPYAFAYHGMHIERGFLEYILRKYPYIDIFFDTHYLRKGASYVINRVWADEPRGSGGHRSNIPCIVQRAYAECLIDFFRKNR
jgi:peptidoglycan/xylan/chitin deacetylase (PgdA/CDA1 family)